MAYKVFVERLSQLSDDQVLFESSPHNNAKHSDIITQGAVMCDVLKKFRTAKRPPSHQLPRKFLVNRITCIDEYTDIIIPPPPFGGVCPCFKASRSGEEYDNKLKRTTAKIIVSIYMTQCVMIDQKLELLKVDAEVFLEYSEKINRLANALDKIDAGAGESARNKLLSETESIGWFMKTYTVDDDVNVRAEVSRRLSVSMETLTGRSLPRNTLIKIQAGLQEISNSVLATCSKRSKQSLLELEDLGAQLRSLKAKTADYFATVGRDDIYMEAVNLYQNETDGYVGEIEGRIEGSTKTWTAVRSQSVCRPVAMLEEERQAMLLQQQQDAAATAAAELDPGRVLRQTGKKIENIGKNIGAVPMKAVDFASNGVEGITSMLETGTRNAVSGVGKMATKGVDTIANVGSKVSSEIGKAVGEVKPAKPLKPPEKKSSLSNPLGNFLS